MSSPVGTPFISAWISGTSGARGGSYNGHADPQPERGAQPMRDPDFINFEPRTQFTRRDFVMTTLATGFAAAVQPVSAQTQISTDTQGLEVAEGKVPVKDGQMPAYVANPANRKNLPVSLAPHAIFTPHHHINNMPPLLAQPPYQP